MACARAVATCRTASAISWISRRTDWRRGRREASCGSSVPDGVRVAARVACLLPPQPIHDTPSEPQSRTREAWTPEHARVGESREVTVEVVVNGRPVASRRLVADGTVARRRLRRRHRSQQLDRPAHPRLGAHQSNLRPRWRVVRFGRPAVARSGAGRLSTSAGRRSHAGWAVRPGRRLWSPTITRARAIGRSCRSARSSRATDLTDNPDRVLLSRASYRLETGWPEPEARFPLPAGRNALQLLVESLVREVHRIGDADHRLDGDEAAIGDGFLGACQRHRRR